MQTIVFSLPAAVLAVTLVGAAPAPPITTLVVTALNPIADAPVYVGVARDIFAKHGLTVQIAPAVPGSGPLQRVVDGSAQIGVAAPAAVAHARARGANLKSIFAAHGDATGKVPTDALFAVIARKTSGVREGHLEDLRGKKVGLASGTDGHKYFFYALAAKGLDPLKSLTITSLPPAGLPSALRNGAVDAIVTGDPTASLVLESTRDAIVVQRGGNYVQFLTLEVVASQYLATHPGTINRYIAAFAEAAQYVRSHRDETTDVLMPRITGVSRAAIRAAVGVADPDMRVSKITVQAAQQSYDFAVNIGLLTAAPTFAEIFDLRILGQIQREYPGLFRDLPPIPDTLKL